MPSLVRADLDAMMQLRVGLVASAHKYASEADLVRNAASRLADSSETNTHEPAADDAVAIALRLEALGAAMDVIVDGLTPEIERLSDLIDSTQRK